MGLRAIYAGAATLLELLYPEDKPITILQRVESRYLLKLCHDIPDRDKWVPLATPWRVLRVNSLQIWSVGANVLHNE